MSHNQLFVSYARSDGTEFALKIANQLKKDGVRIWIDQADIPYGISWDTELQKSLENSDTVLFVASKNGVSSENVLDELYYALEAHKTIIPLLIHDCKLPFRLARKNYLDFRTNFDYHYLVLLSALNTNNNIESQRVNAPRLSQKSGNVNFGRFLNFAIDNVSSAQEINKAKNPFIIAIVLIIIIIVCYLIGAIK